MNVSCGQNIFENKVRLYALFVIYNFNLAADIYLILYFTSALLLVSDRNILSNLHKKYHQFMIAGENAFENQLLQLCTARTAWSESDQVVRTVHSCNS